MQFTMAHANLNVLDLPRSIAFYEEALGLRVQRDKTADDGSFRIAFLADGHSGAEGLHHRDHPHQLRAGTGKTGASPPADTGLL